VNLELRDATPADAPAIKQLMDEYALALFGEAQFSEEEIRSWFSMPNIWMQVAERDGAPVAYVDVMSEESGHFAMDARTLEADVVPVLFAAAEAHARRQTASPVLRGVVQGDEPVLREAFEAGGWALIRSFFQMRIELDDELPEPEWPEGLTARNAEPGEEERVYEAHMDSFADHWDFRRQPFDVWSAYTTESHRYDPSLWWLVEDGEELAAISLNTWHFSGDPRFGWIAVLGVRPAWRKRGIATALLRHSFRDFRQRSATKVGLGVDGENTTGAVRLYERVGMRMFRRNDTYEKTL
jgi:ribosomal protein S18 acetylase RimI-like enzyme